MARNPELEAQIAKSDDDAAGYAVYADWLCEHDDPRGELIAIELALERADNADLRARARALHDEHDATWLGAMADCKDDLDLRWRRGFIDAVEIGTGPDSDLDGDLQASVYGQLRALPVAALVRQLVFGALRDDDGEPDWKRSTKPLLDHGVPASLRRLAYVPGGGFHRPLSWTSLGPLEPVYPLLGNLVRLEIAMGSIHLGTIVLPSLREFVVHTGGFTKANMRSVVDATWPNLEHLSLTFGDTADEWSDHGAECELEDVVPLLDEQFARRHARLRHLAIANAAFVDDVISMLVNAPILRQLRALDLSKGTLSDIGVDAILAHADAFRHLETIDISASYVSDTRIAALRDIIENTVAAEMKTGDTRYCSIGK